MGELADRARRETGESGAVLHQSVEVPRGNELGVRLAVHVDELREQELDVVVLDVALDVVAGFRRGEGLAHALKLSRFARTANVENSHTEQLKCWAILYGRRGQAYLHSPD